MLGFLVAYLLATSKGNLILNNTAIIMHVCCNVMGHREALVAQLNSVIHTYKCSLFIRIKKYTKKKGKGVNIPTYIYI